MYVRIKYMKKIMVFGTFDIFHLGHQSFLQQAKKYGDYLIAVVARDMTVKQVKNKKPKNNEQERLNEIQRSGLVNEVILGSLKDKYKAIKKYRPDVICLGYDQKFFVEKLTEELEYLGLNKTKIVRLESFKPEKYKSSIIAKKSVI